RVCPSVCPLTLGVPIRVFFYISCPHQSAPLHQLSPSECPFTSVVPIRVPLYISCTHQSAPLHQLYPSECPFTSGIPITLPLYIRYSHQSAPLHSKYPFLSYLPIRVHHYIIFPIRVPLSITCAHLCPLNIKWARQSAP
ncbi:unnamed protein product, partial [Staurois parvus]